MWVKCCRADDIANRMMSLFSQSLHSNEAQLISTVCLRVMVGVGEMLFIQSRQGRPLIVGLGAET